MTAEHPCRGMTKRQVEVFEQIATGDALPRSTQKVIDRLVTRGVIVRCADKVLGRDCLGAIAIPQYEVPLPIHAQWCEWCSEHPDFAEAPTQDKGQ